MSLLLGIRETRAYAKHGTKRLQQIPATCHSSSHPVCTHYSARLFRACGKFSLLSGQVLVLVKTFLFMYQILCIFWIWSIYFHLILIYYQKDLTFWICFLNKKWWTFWLLKSLFSDSVKHIWRKSDDNSYFNLTLYLLIFITYTIFS